MSNKPTSEQAAIIYHPRGKHARVLAVAGAGKTTTMVSRVQYQVQELRIDPRQICILMFNRRARLQFKDKLSEVLPAAQRPQAHTFHSYAFSLIADAAKKGLAADTQNTWTGDKEEQVRFNIHHAIQSLVQQKIMPPDVVDADEAMECISLWKGSLIPPERAGHRSNKYLPLVYEEFERLRMDKNATTFDDFVPLAVGLLESERAISQHIIDSFETVIVDEYQDVNYGQQRLIELLAGTRSDIMVVGDDDQTIYEWRGARPNYIREEFARVFSNKPAVDYKLTHTFRFGPVIAQAAQNVIAFNLRRTQKLLIAQAAEKVGQIHVLQDTSEQPTDMNRELASQVITLVRQTGKPQEIVVLARMYSQLTGLEAEFLSQNIPYRVLGHAPFFERREIMVLLDYLRLGAAFVQPNPDAHTWLLSIANVPNRKLSRDVLARTARSYSQATVQQVLNSLSDSISSPFNQRQRDAIDELAAVLERINERIAKEPKLLAGELLAWLVTRLDYQTHFDNYYGKGETSEDRKRAVASFCAYAAQTQKTVFDFLNHIQTLDTTRGVPEDQQIVMTTVFQVKGEEFDYVFIPNCDEGYMPCLFASENTVFDLDGTIAEPPASALIENERRLFYVAVTRAHEAVFIGTSSAPRQGKQGNPNVVSPSRFIDEMQLEATHEVMGAFQRVAAGAPGALNDLSAAAQQHAGKKAIISNLLREYLPARSLSLPVDVEQVVQNTPEIPFKYPAANSNSVSISAAAPVAPLQQKEKAWWDSETNDVS